MLDIKWIRDHMDEYVEKIALRGDPERNINAAKRAVEEDNRRCKLLAERDEKKALQNQTSKEIVRYKKAEEDATPLLEEMKKLSEEIKALHQEISEVEKEERHILLHIPNLPHSSVVQGADDAENKLVRSYQKPTEFSFQPKPHWEIGKKLGILDAETAAKVTGARFHFYKGAGARLERAVINFFMDFHAQNGYTEILPPYLVNRDSMTGTGQLPKFEEDAFKLEGGEYFLIPTAEVPVTNIYRDTILPGKNLPICYAAYSACFRAEVGSAGRDVRGLIRQHQFNKVELVHFCKPKESYRQLELITRNAELLLQKLELPYRVVSLCGGDLGFSSAKTYDIEVWLPSYQEYKEISSCSNFEDFQARRANIRFKDFASDKAQFVHTLNGSGLAVGRTVAAILENYQNADGSVTIPEVLRPYMRMDEISTVQ